MKAERRWALLSRKVIGRQDNPMLIRWRLIQTPWFGIYLHFIHREDLDRLPHDHPWTFWSLILRGSYDEEEWNDTRTVTDFLCEHRTWRRGQLHHFPLSSAHRITAVHGKVTTLVLVGRKKRTWGFYDDMGNFIDWREYHAVAPQFVRGRNITDDEPRSTLDELMPKGKSWAEYRRLVDTARQAGVVGPNPYHYFADRYGPTFASPAEHQGHIARMANVQFGTGTYSEPKL